MSIYDEYKFREWATEQILKRDPRTWAEFALVIIITVLCVRYIINVIVDVSLRARPPLRAMQPLLPTRLPQPSSSNPCGLNGAMCPIRSSASVALAAVYICCLVCRTSFQTDGQRCCAGRSPG